MRKRPLGNTGIDVSELCLGTWGLSGDPYGPVDEAEMDRVIDRAVELGIDVFDTADVYGKGEMERRLGRRLPRETTYVVTKIGTDLDSVPPRKRFDLDHLRPAFERSRERIGRERLDVVLLHNPTMHAMGTSEPAEFLKQLKRLGALRAWGVSAGSADVARAAVEQDADVVEIPYNVFWSAELHQITGAVAGKGAALLARSILAHGLLAGEWPDDREFPLGDHRRDRWTTDDLRRRMGQLEAVRAVGGGELPSVRATAVRFVLANQLVTSAVIGPRSVAQLEQLVEEAGEGPPYLRDTVLAELAARVRGAGIAT